MEDIPLGFILILFGFFVAAIVLTAIAIAWKQRSCSGSRTRIRTITGEKDNRFFRSFRHARMQKRAIFYVSCSKIGLFL